MQRPEENGFLENQWSTNAARKSKGWTARNALNSGDELMC